jgi:hypothetical protein
VKEDLLDDGIHFNAKGSKIVDAEIQKLLQGIGLSVDQDPVKQMFGSPGSKSALEPLYPWHVDEGKLKPAKEY